uniref:Uncharacterized protein n=1 Tax=Caenorhabditis japonica TaxID=281687 RepID=A0A8R1DLL9_CAEJA
MQKTITDMVQKQVEKEKSMKRRERSLLKSLTRERSTDSAQETVEVKQEPVNFFEDIEVDKPSTSKSESQEASEKHETSEVREVSVASTSCVTTMQKTPKPSKKRDEPREKRKYTKSAKKAPPVQNGKIEPPVIEVEKVIVKPAATNIEVHQIKVELQEEVRHTSPSCSQAEPKTGSEKDLSSASASSETAPQPSTQDSVEKLPPTPENKETTPPPKPIEENVKKFTPPHKNGQTVVSPPTHAPPVAVTATASFEESILRHLPERIVKKINQPFRADYNLLLAHKKMTGIDPIVAEAEAVLLPQDWDRQRVMKGLGCNQYVSPATSRQSAETDLSSEANRSFETSMNDSSSSPPKSCQIPDYMIHRDAPQKIFIVANGYPAYFEEFPRRIQK